MKAKWFAVDDEAQMAILTFDFGGKQRLLVSGHRDLVAVDVHFDFGFVGGG